MSTSDSHVGELLSGYLDNELTQQDAQRVRLHCEACEQCQLELEELMANAKLLRQTDFGVQSDWHERIPDRIARSTRIAGWVALIIGMLVGASVVVTQFATQLSTLPWYALLIVGGVYGGLLLLFVSVLRQRLIERKTDRYKDVEI